jgi:UDP-glucose 6-dehydrogenase
LQYGVALPLICSICESNTDTQSRLISKIVWLNTHGDITARVWGLEAKAVTDDLRDSPIPVVVSKLAESGYLVLAYDLTVREKDPLPTESPKIAVSPVEVREKRRPLVVLTEWTEFS